MNVFGHLHKAVDCNHSGTLFNEYANKFWRPTCIFNQQIVPVSNRKYNITSICLELELDIKVKHKNQQNKFQSKAYFTYKQETTPTTYIPFLVPFQERYELRDDLR